MLCTPYSHTSYNQQTHEMGIEENPLKDALNAIDENLETFATYFRWENITEQLPKVMDEAIKCKTEIEVEAKSQQHSPELKALLIQKANICMTEMADVGGKILINRFSEQYKFQMAVHGYVPWFSGVFDVTSCALRFSTILAAMSMCTTNLYKIASSNVAKIISDCRDEFTDDLQKVSSKMLLRIRLLQFWLELLKLNSE